MDQFRDILLGPFQKHKSSAPLPGTIKRVRSLNAYVDQRYSLPSSTTPNIVSSGPFIEENDPFEEPCIIEEDRKDNWEEKDPFGENNEDPWASKQRVELGESRSAQEDLISFSDEVTLPQLILSSLPRQPEEGQETSKPVSESSSPQPMSPPTPREPSAKHQRLESLFAQPTVDLTELKRLCWSGIPFDFRSLAWQLMLV